MKSYAYEIILTSFMILYTVIIIYISFQVYHCMKQYTISCIPCGETYIVYFIWKKTCNHLWFLLSMISYTSDSETICVGVWFRMLPKRGLGLVQMLSPAGSNATISFESNAAPAPPLLMTVLFGIKIGFGDAFVTCHTITYAASVRAERDQRPLL